MLLNLLLERNVIPQCDKDDIEAAEYVEVPQMETEPPSHKRRLVKVGIISSIIASVQSKTCKITSLYQGLVNQFVVLELFCIYRHYYFLIICSN